jgi:hypothetical protein
VNEKAQRTSIGLMRASSGSLSQCAAASKPCEDVTTGGSTKRNSDHSIIITRRKFTFFYRSFLFKRRKTMFISQESALVTLINVFDTTPEQQQELIEQWVRFTEEVKQEPGRPYTLLMMEINR